MVLVLPVPGGPQMRLNLLAASRRAAETQLVMASVCESLSLNAASVDATSVSTRAEEPNSGVLCRSRGSLAF
jgi:hypothetical protein